jgi:hypothetical protein
VTRRPVRTRTARRAEERAARQQVRDRQRLATLERGGAPERPIEVTSAAVIEPRARSMRCPLCDGDAELLEHRAEAGLRVVELRCRRCHAPRRLWFRLVASGPS